MSNYALTCCFLFPAEEEKAKKDAMYHIKTVNAETSDILSELEKEYKPPVSSKRSKWRKSIFYVYIRNLLLSFLSFTFSSRKVKCLKSMTGKEKGDKEEGRPYKRSELFFLKSIC